MVEGTQVGAYRVLQQIGEGGMGSVWLAEHIALGRHAALKMLHPEFSNRTDIVTRFFNEARAATSIADPGIVQIFDFGQHVDGSAYIVMELLDGEPLDRRLKREGALTLVDGLRLMRQVASTLGAAHACGIVHRDLKPENIYIVRDPEVPGGERPKVLDFGIAKLAGDHAGVKTQTTAMMGTPIFMSPEQCRGAGYVDQRSDVYALGCVLFTLVVGRPPFNADGIGDIIAMHLREPAPAPSKLRPGISPEIDQLVLRCLAKDPADRFRTAGELAKAIGEMLGSSPQVPTVHTSGYAMTTAPTTLSCAAGTRVEPLSKRPRIVMSTAIAGLGAVGLAIALAATRGGEQHAPTTAQLPAPATDRFSATAPLPAPAATQPSAVAASSASVEVPLSALPDPSIRVAPVLKDLLARFVAWSHDHPGAPCPDTVVLGAPNDPWGHPPAITCTDQPGDQIAGAVSAGPDGEPGTADDIASWQLGRDVTTLVRGTRWPVVSLRSAAKPAVRAMQRPAALTPPKPADVRMKPASADTSTKPAPVEVPTKPEPADMSTKPAPAAVSTEPAPADMSTKPVPADVSTKPAPAVQFDENGLPITR